MDQDPVYVVIFEVVDLHSANSTIRSNALEAVNKIKEFVRDDQNLLTACLTYKGGLVYHWHKNELSSPESILLPIKLADLVKNNKNFKFRLKTVISCGRYYGDGIAKAIALLGLCLPEEVLISSEYHSEINQFKADGSFQHQKLYDRFWRETNIYINNKLENDDNLRKLYFIPQVMDSAVHLFSNLGYEKDIIKSLESSYQIIENISTNELITNNNAIDAIRNLKLSKKDTLLAVFRADKDPGFWSNRRATKLLMDLKSKGINQQRVIIFDNLQYPSRRVLDIAQIHDNSSTLREIDRDIVAKEYLDNFEYGITIIPSRKIAILPVNYAERDEPINLKAGIIASDLYNYYKTLFKQLYEESYPVTYNELLEEYSKSDKKPGDYLYDLTEPNLTAESIEKMIDYCLKLGDASWTVEIALVHSVLMRLKPNNITPTLVNLIRQTLMGDEDAKNKLCNERC